MTTGNTRLKQLHDDMRHVLDAVGMAPVAYNDGLFFELAALAGTDHEQLCLTAQVEQVLGNHALGHLAARDEVIIALADLIYEYEGGLS